MKRRTLGISIPLGSLALIVLGAVALVPDSATSGDIESVEAALRSDSTTPVLPLTAPPTTTTLAPAESDSTADADAESQPISPPVGLRISALEVDAPVDAYGVNRATGQMAVPNNVTDVGWYEYGPRPGEPGSAVLAAHVDLAGSGPGVFFDLRTLVEGDIVTVLHEDGSASPFRVVARSTYNKDELPLDVIFSREGPSVLTLITCGGGFNSNISRYDSNVVVYAVPDLGDQPTEGTHLQGHTRRAHHLTPHRISGQVYATTGRLNGCDAELVCEQHFHLIGGGSVFSVFGSRRRADATRPTPSHRRTRTAVALAIAVCVSIAPGIGIAEELPEFTGNEFADLFNTAPLDNLAPIGPAPTITGNSSVDARIRRIGEGRGYLRRPLPAGPLASVAGYPIQPSAVEAWFALSAAARADGHTLLLRSGFRSHSTQTVIFLRRLSSFSDSAIDARLRSVAVPGYSKHHTGYAIDITQPGYAFTSFKNSPAYRWLAANNYENAKRYGWIPSYPPDATLQGPNPEAWELTYVGVENIWCYGFSGSEGNTFCDDRTSVFEEEIEWMVETGITAGCNQPIGDRFCPDESVTRGQLAAFLHRVLGDSISPTGDPIDFTDTIDSVFSDDARWLSAAGITNGCGVNTFCPDEPLTRGQLAAFFVRAFSLPDMPDAATFEDDNSSMFEREIEALAAAGVTKGCNPPANDRYCPRDPVTRGQMAAFLRRAVEG